jgi:hypothetical protein
MRFGGDEVASSVSMLPHQRHLIASSWISSAQNGHRFTAGLREV